MTDFPSITPDDGALRGLRSFKSKRRGGAEKIKGMNADAQRYANAVGVVIVGRHDASQAMPNQKGGSTTWWTRTCWCSPALTVYVS
jgi:hypothetical protein